MLNRLSQDFTCVKSLMMEHCPPRQIRSLVEVFKWDFESRSVIPLNSGLVYVSYRLVRDGFHLVLNSDPIRRDSVVKFPYYEAN